MLTIGCAEQPFVRFSKLSESQERLESFLQQILLDPFKLAFGRLWLNTAAGFWYPQYFTSMPQGTGAPVRADNQALRSSEFVLPNLAVPAETVAHFADFHADYRSPIRAMVLSFIVDQGITFFCTPCLSDRAR